MASGHLSIEKHSKACPHPPEHPVFVVLVEADEALQLTLVQRDEAGAILPIGSDADNPGWYLKRNYSRVFGHSSVLEIYRGFLKADELATASPLHTQRYQAGGDMNHHTIKITA